MMAYYIVKVRGITDNGRPAQPTPSRAFTDRPKAEAYASRLRKVPRGTVTIEVSQ